MTRKPFAIVARKPFGLVTNVELSKNKSNSKSIKTYSFNNDGYISHDEIEVNQAWISKYKVYISYAYGERGSFPYLVIGKPFIGEPNSCCSETYLVVGPFDKKSECENVISYMQTKFFRFLVLLRKNTQHATAKVYANVPMQDFSEQWTDEKLYKKYVLTTDEIAFIDSMIRPMDLGA